ncbi:hypothetical protein D3C81_174220 [compost metagenome]
MMPAESTTTSTDYLVITTCGRKLGWAATGLDSLFRELRDKGFTATFVQPMSEYEAEILAKEAQEDLMHEFRTELERELKESA